VTKIFLAVAMALALITPAGSAAFAESIDTSGFTVQNADGSYGPYQTQDLPVLSDRGGYTQSGEIWRTLADQFGNGYYLDLGPAPQVQQVATTVPTTAPIPTPSANQARPQSPITLPTPELLQRPAGWEISAMLAQVNQERTSRGLQPLIEDLALDVSARQYASYEAARACYGHDCGSELFQDRAKAYMRTEKSRHQVGECIAWYTDDPVKVVAAGWMLSAPHRAILLSTTMTHVGAGIATGAAPTQSGPAVDGPMNDAQLATAYQYGPGMRYWVIDLAG
jgi:uncharacterized protein YkwD